MIDLLTFRHSPDALFFPQQRWIYRIDPKRVNEFGQVMTSDADAADAATSGTKAVAADTKTASSDAQAKGEDATPVKYARRGSSAGIDGGAQTAQ